MLGFLLKHETGWLGLADMVVVVDSVARNGFGLWFAVGNVVVSGLVNGVGLSLVNGVGLGLVNSVDLGLVNGVGLGLEVVEPCRIWVFFSF